MTRVVTRDQALASSYTTVACVTAVTVVHDYCKTFLYISFVFRNVNPSRVFACLEVRPESSAGSFVSVTPATMYECVCGKVGASASLVIGAL